MRVKLLRDGARVPGLVVTNSGEVFDVPVKIAEELIRRGDAEPADKPIPQVIETREPDIEVRDPQPMKAKRSRKL